MKKRILSVNKAGLLFCCFTLGIAFTSCDQKSNPEEVATATEPTETNTQETSATEIGSPTDTALEFINSYLTDALQADMVEWVNSSQLTSKNFKTELKNMVDKAFQEDPEMGLGFDPIVDGQDVPDNGFELDSFDSNTNYVVVKGKNQPDYKVTLKMVLENNQWLVDGCGVVNIPEDKQSPR